MSKHEKPAAPRGRRRYGPSQVGASVRATSVQYTGSFRLPFVRFLFSLALDVPLSIPHLPILLSTFTSKRRRTLFALVHAHDVAHVTAIQQNFLYFGHRDSLSTSPCGSVASSTIIFKFVFSLPPL